MTPSSTAPEPRPRRRREAHARGVPFGLLTGRWLDLLYGLWFVPGLVALLCLVLGFLLTRIDHAAGPLGVAWAFSGSPSTASTILTTIAGSLVTVSGLVFSLTIVILQLISAQLTPRAMRGILGDRLNQVVAGSFVGIFAYCLLVLTTVRIPSESGTEFVPALSVAVAICLGFLGLALLLVYMHHMAQTTQVQHVTAHIVRQTLRQIDHLYPTGFGEPLDEDGADLVAAWAADGPPCLVYPWRPGYVQLIAMNALVERLARPGLRLHLPVCPGDFVTPKTAIAALWPGGAVGCADVQTVRRCVIIRDERDMTQDTALGIRQLTDIALRAIAPAVNDPTTAVTCIGYLQAVLEQVAGRTCPAAVRRFAAGQVVVVTRQRTFREQVEAFLEIGRYASTDARVAGAALEALGRIAEAAAAVKAGDHVALLAAVAAAVAGPAIERAPTDLDRALLTERLQRVEQVTSSVAG
jgi:uncharacterized membrane protein